MNREPEGVLIMWYDVAPDGVADHDHWHTHEHMPERLAIPGFLRGTRWITRGGSPRYLVMYEVADVGTLTSDAYLERLNHPTPWTTRIMASMRGMARGLCETSIRQGAGLGSSLLSIRFSPPSSQHAELRQRLSNVLATMASSAGIASAHLLESTARPPMTKEQSLRGADNAVDWVLLVTGYDEDVVGGAGSQLERDLGGALDAVAGFYGLAHEQLTWGR